MFSCQDLKNLKAGMLPGPVGCPEQEEFHSRSFSRSVQASDSVLSHLLLENVA